jgi:hypothetical protein
MAPREPDAAEKYHDGNERDIVQKQDQPVEASEAISGDPEIDADAVHVLPGTGGPDDVGDVEDVPDDYNPTGKPGGGPST